MAWSVTGSSIGSRQPLTYNLRPGQFRGNRVNVFPSQTIINNNIITGGGYDYSCCHHEENSTPKWMQWMMGIGLGTTVLGGILDLFKKDKPEGAGDPPAPKQETAADPKDSKEYKDLNTKYQALADEVAKLKEAAKTQQTTTGAKVNTEAKTDFENGQIVNVHDEELGSTADINGTVTVNDDGTVSIKDVLNTYTYKNTSKTATYKGKEYPVYTLTGAKNNSTGQTQNITQQSYILVNGQLVQPKDMELDGLGLGSIAKNSPPPETPTPKDKTTRKGDSTTETAVPPKPPKTKTEYTESYTVKLPSGNRVQVKVDKQGKQHCFDKDGNPINAETFKKQCGKSAEDIITKGRNTKKNQESQAKVDQWNKQHPNEKIQYNNGKFSTTAVKGRKFQTITANSFEELQKKTTEWKNNS